MDFGEIKKVCMPVIEELDHRLLNEIPGLENPTSENLAVWIWDRIKPELPELKVVEVWESSSSGCRYQGP
jgi:6-pyruvoyltetrahydropterin/6-carboxytetrahydropterin synthase